MSRSLPTISLRDGLPADAYEQAKANAAILRSLGWRIIGGWTRKAPEALYHGYAYHHRDLSDHPYRMLRNGTTIFVAEPYNPDTEEIAWFVNEHGDEWDLDIGTLPLHYPGRTTPLLFRRRLLHS